MIDQQILFAGITPFDDVRLAVVLPLFWYDMRKSRHITCLRYKCNVSVIFARESGFAETESLSTSIENLAS